MQNLINAPNVTFSNSETIDSQQLLVMVNETRKEYGEKPIRNNDFIARIKDELEGEHYEIFVVQKTNNTASEVIEMIIKQALRVAARESKAVRRSLIDKLEQQSKPKSQAELNLAYAMAQVEQERRLKSIENQVVQVVEEIEHIKEGTLPQGYQGYSYLKSTYGLSDAKCRQLVIVWEVENKKNSSCHSKWSNFSNVCRSRRII